jgi:hypothetical protein
MKAMSIGAKDYHTLKIMLPKIFFKGIGKKLLMRMRKFSTNILDPRVLYKSGPLPVFLNKVLLQHSHTHSKVKNIYHLVSCRNSLSVSGQSVKMPLELLKKKKCYWKGWLQLRF